MFKILFIFLLLIPALLFTLTAERSAYSVEIIISGLFTFGLLFSINTSLQALGLSKENNRKTSIGDIGFYLNVNAYGKIIGTLLSGVLFQFGGFPVTLIASSLVLLFSWITIFKVHPKPIV